jgi:subtilase family serine protease
LIKNEKKSIVGTVEVKNGEGKSKVRVNNFVYVMERVMRKYVSLEMKVKNKKRKRVEVIIYGNG